MANLQAESDTRRRVAVVTGSRGDFNLLRPVIGALRARTDLDVAVIAAGEHLLPPARTIDDVAEEFEIAAAIDMQFAGESGAHFDAQAVGRGVSGFAEAFGRIGPDIVLVLGDSLEAFAASSAASVAGIRVAHMMAGDKAIPPRSESISHAITKLSHIHLPASPLGAERIIAMGEEVRAVHLVGSPALDGVAKIPPAADDLFRGAGGPEMIFLMEPVSRHDEEEFAAAERVLECCGRFGNVLCLPPRAGPGSEGIIRAIRGAGCAVLPRRPRLEFLALLRRAGLIVGNSSAGIIEAAALGAWCINLGPRQQGRDRARNTIDVEDLEPDPEQIDAALQRLLFHSPYPGPTPWGDGRTGTRVAELLATCDFVKHPVRKRCSY